MLATEKMTWISYLPNMQGKSILEGLLFLPGLKRDANDTRATNDPYIRPQMIPKKSKEWHGGWNGMAGELM